MKRLNYLIKVSFRKSLLALALLMCTFTSFAQKFISLQGKITDAETGKALSFVNISLKNSTIGTFSNDDGFYLFHIPYKNRNDTLWVSSIGYNSYKQPISKISGNRLDILLQPKTYSLSEITAKPQNALEIVKKAIAKIPENYPTKPINMDGFYREMTFENDTCVEMAEAACEFYYQPYNEVFSMYDAYQDYYKYSESHYNYFLNNILSLVTNPKDRLNIIEGRSSNLFHKNHLKVVPRGGPLSLTAYDLAKSKYIFLKNALLKKYNYKLTDIVSYNGRRVYLISYKSKKRNDKSGGSIYIDIDTKAFVRIIANLSMKGKVKYTKYWTPALYKKKRKRCKDIMTNYLISTTIDYKQNKDSWVLSRINQKESFDYIFSKHYINKKNRNGFSYVLDKSLIINNIKKDTSVLISEKDDFSNSLYSILYEHDLNYNPKFWENYNLIKTTPIQDTIIKQLELGKSLNSQFQEQFVKIDSITAPIAIKKKQINPYTHLEDNYFWMQNIKDPKVLKYIEEENKYTQNEMLPLKQDYRNLYHEMLNRLVKDTVRQKDLLVSGNFAYYYKKERNSIFENLYRKNTKTKKEELVLDIKKLSNNNDNYNIDNIYVQSGNRLLAYTESYGLSYENKLVVWDMKTKRKKCEIENVSTLYWTNDNKAFVYSQWDSTNRIDRLMLHKLNQSPDKDQVLYFEKELDKSIYTWYFGNRWIILHSEGDFHYNNTYLVDLNASFLKPKQIVKSKFGYSDIILISKDTLYSLSNENDKTTIYYATSGKFEKKYWQTLIQDNNNSLFRTFLCLKDYLVVKCGNSFQSYFKIYTKKGKFIKDIKFKEETYDIQFKFESKSEKNNKFKYQYSSLIYPTITYEYDVNTMQEKIVRKVRIKNYNEKNYKSKLLWAISTNGTKIPISLIYNKKKSKKNGKSPLYLYAYGSYGSSVAVDFQPERLSLLDRGIIYAIAHVRGGSELGEKWHTNAMQLKKKNSFDDYIACAKYLIDKKYTSNGRIIAEGGSAGGLTISASVNQKPELFNTAILTVPFLDVLGSLTNPSAKFSKEDYADFGNPADKNVFEYIKSYSPYENIIAQHYPNMMYYIGLNDTRVEYWQSLKSVAKLRSLKTDSNKLYLKSDLYSGHEGLSGLGGYYSEWAFIYAFIFDNLGIKY